MLQTNGTFLDDEWAALLADHQVLVGVSMDGPASMHDAYRVNRAGRGSHAQVLRGWRALERHDVPRNILCTVHRANQDHPLEVYRYFRDELGARHIQFIPIVERVHASQLAVAENGWRKADGTRLLYVQEGHHVTSRSVDPAAWGAFLTAVFDEWVTRDVGSCFVQLFDVMLGNLFGMYSLCVHSPECGNALVPGLTFPEEGDMNNRWYDASEPYEESHFYQVASYVNEHDLGGMFVYALDRDGRNYDEDLHRIVPSNLLWTKTAITESQGMKLETAKAAANHYLDRMALRQATVRDNGVSVDEARTAVEKAANLYEANKAVLGGDYGEGFSDTYDPTLEAGLLDIDTSVLMQQIDKATEAINADATAADAKIDLRTARDAAIDGLTSRIYTADQVAAWSAALKTALDATTPTPTPDPDEDNDHENDGQENDADTETTPDADKDANAGNKSQAQPEQLSSTGASVNAIVAAGVALAAAGAALALSRRRA
ncbi:EndoS/ChiA family endoglycosidase [Bifidobacterium longum]|uniref:DUF7917 domain-containing protein n=1 Tax=Bifidobacterium longum TaxID=216816 RepID=UPI002E17FF15